MRQRKRKQKISWGKSRGKRKSRAGYRHGLSVTIPFRCAGFQVDTILPIWCDVATLAMSSILFRQKEKILNKQILYIISKVTL